MKDELNDKQKIVLVLYRRGLTQKEIGLKVGTTQGTISHQIQVIKRKRPELKEELERIAWRNYIEHLPEMTEEWKKMGKELGVI